MFDTNEKKKRIRLVLGAAIIGIMLSGCSNLQSAVAVPETHAEAGSEATEKKPETQGVTETEFQTERETEALAEKEERTIEDVFNNSSLYPQELLDKLAENEEMLDYVLDYPEKKDLPCTEYIEEEITVGEVPLFIQWDERWGYGLYGDTLLGINGCGPTCIAMVATGLTGRNDITPLKVAQYSAENGYLTASADTTWFLMSAGCEAFGIRGRIIDMVESTMIQSLENGSPIICSVRPGDFTNGGHFIVLTEYTEGKFRVHDPNSRIRSSRLWGFDELSGQTKGLWNYTLMEEEQSRNFRTAR